MIVDPARSTVVARNFLDGDVLGRSWDGWCDLSIESNVWPGRSIYAAERIFCTYRVEEKARLKHVSIAQAHRSPTGRRTRIRAFGRCRSIT